jgi:hypothetical protein
MKQMMLMKQLKQTKAMMKRMKPVGQRKQMKQLKIRRQMLIRVRQQLPQLHLFQLHLALQHNHPVKEEQTEMPKK